MRKFAAKVVSQTGEESLAEVVNLRPVGFVLLSGEAFRCGEQVMVSFEGLTLQVEVLFRCLIPAALVVAVTEQLSPSEQSALYQLALENERLEPDEWGGDKTPAELPELNLTPLAPEGIGHKTDSQGALDPLLSSFMEPDTAEPSAAQADALMIDPLIAAAAELDDHSGPTPVVSAPAPLQPSASDLAQPVQQPTSIEDSDQNVGSVVDTLEVAPILPGPTMPAAAGESISSDGESLESLPDLASDGFTVSFESTHQYRAQFQKHLSHGGLVVASSPISIGTQRMLALKIPGQDKYTISARVIYSRSGRVGFIVDSLSLHRRRLESMASGASALQQ